MKKEQGNITRSFVWIVIGTALLALTSQAEDIDLRRWAKRADVLIQGDARVGVVEFAVVPEVYAAAQPDLSDLVVVDAADKIVPHILRMEVDSVALEKRLAPANILNRVHSPKEFSSAVLDFGSPILKNGLEIETAGENFRRQVMVEASEDGQGWQILRKSAWLFRIGFGRSADDRRRVDLPENNFRFLRVTVFHAPDDPEEVAIISAFAWQLTKKSTPPDLVEWEVAAQNIVQEDGGKVTNVDIDLGYENLPLYAIELSAANANFLRSVAVIGRNQKRRIIERQVEDGPARSWEVDEPWQQIASGTIHRFTAGGETDENLRLMLGVGRGWRYLRVRIINQDNPPLQISTPRVWGYIAMWYSRPNALAAISTLETPRRRNSNTTSRPTPHACGKKASQPPSWPPSVLLQVFHLTHRRNRRGASAISISYGWPSWRCWPCSEASSGVRLKACRLAMATGRALASRRLWRVLRAGDALLPLCSGGWGIARPRGENHG